LKAWGGESDWIVFFTTESELEAVFGVEMRGARLCNLSSETSDA